MKDITFNLTTDQAKILRDALQRSLESYKKEAELEEVYQKHIEEIKNQPPSLFRRIFHLKPKKQPILRERLYEDMTLEERKEAIRFLDNLIEQLG